MHRLSLVLLLTSVLPVGLHAQTTAQSTLAKPTASLATPYPTTLGDMVARTMTEYMPVVQAMNPWNLSTPVVVAFDQQSQHLIVSVFGSRSSVDDAKAALEYFRSKVLPVTAAFVAQRHQATITDADLVLVYYDRTQGPKEIIRRESEKYVVNQ
jgi:hypothetical protein